MDNSQPPEPKLKITRNRRRMYQGQTADKETSEIELAKLNNDLDMLSIQRQQQADPIINKWVWAARAVGLLPLPWVDFLGLLAIQTHMVSELSKIYQVDFSAKKTRNLILLILGSANPSWIVTALLSNLSKLMPIVGLAGTVMTQPVIAGAATYAIGKIFINHFELGGTLLDFEAKSTRKYFMQQFEQGKEKIKQTARKKDSDSDVG